MRHLQEHKIDLGVTSCSPFSSCVVCGAHSNNTTSESKHEEEGLRLCACCGIILCQSCCSNEVYELSKEKVVRVCAHCYRHSSRIVHPDDQDLQAALQALDSKSTQGQERSKKLARCARCGDYVPRSLEEIEHHLDAACGQEKTGGDSSTFATVGTTRILYRTAISAAPSLVKPREACVLQDSFADGDGTIYIYEITVRHRSIESSPGHKPVEVLFLCYVARPVPNVPNASILTIISQVRRLIRVLTSPK